MVDFLTKVGSIFALAVFWHFIADWVFQSNQEAITKSRDSEVRAWHCIKYTAMMMLPFIGMSIMGHWLVACAVGFILFVSHYVIDSYVPVMLWAKYLRKHPAFNEYKYVEVRKGEYHKVTDDEAFMKMASTPIGLILIITMDQLFHIAFLIPVVVLMVIYGM